MLGGFIGGLFGGRPEMPEPDYKALWQDYRKWSREDREQFEKDYSREKARMAAAGMKPGTGNWDDRLKKIETEYEGKQKELLEGPTAEMLTQGFTSYKRRYAIESEGRKKYVRSHPVFEQRYFGGKTLGGRRIREVDKEIAERTAQLEAMTMEDYYLEQFGEPERPQESKALTRAKQAASGRRIGGIVDQDNIWI